MICLQYRSKKLFLPVSKDSLVISHQNTDHSKIILYPCESCNNYAFLFDDVVFHWSFPEDTTKLSTISLIFLYSASETHQYYTWYNKRQSYGKELKLVIGNISSYNSLIIYLLIKFLIYISLNMLKTCRFIGYIDSFIILIHICIVLYNYITILF